MELARWRFARRELRNAVSSLVLSSLSAHGRLHTSRSLKARYAIGDGNCIRGSLVE